MIIGLLETSLKMKAQGEAISSDSMVNYQTVFPVQLG